MFDKVSNSKMMVVYTKKFMEWDIKRDLMLNCEQSVLFELFYSLRRKINVLSSCLFFASKNFHVTLNTHMLVIKEYFIENVLTDFNHML